MVAAWIRADTGVGPAMASGSQVVSGSWADLPMADQRRSSVIKVATPVLSEVAWGLIEVMEKVLKRENRKAMATPKVISPTLVMMNAFLPAVALISSVYQKPIRA